MSLNGIRLVLMFSAFLFIFVPIGTQLFSIQVLAGNEASLLLGLGLLALILANALRLIDERLKTIESQGP